MKLECYLRAIGLVYGLIELVYSLPLFFFFFSLWCLVAEKIDCHLNLCDYMEYEALILF